MTFRPSQLCGPLSAVAVRARCAYGVQRRASGAPRERARVQCTTELRAGRRPSHERVLQFRVTYLVLRVRTVVGLICACSLSIVRFTAVRPGVCLW